MARIAGVDIPENIENPNPVIAALAEKKLGENPTKQDLAALRYKYGYK